MIRIVHSLNIFAFDVNGEMELLNIPNEKHAVVCLDQRPTIFRLKGSGRITKRAPVRRGKCHRCSGRSSSKNGDCKHPEQ